MRLCFCLLVASAIFGSCSTKDKYDVANYLNTLEEDSVKTSIVSYIFIAPPYTLMKDRFRSEHRNFYSLQASKFSIVKYFVAPDGTNYFFVLRPGPKSDEKRGVGGRFKGGPDRSIAGFREIFVTPLMPEDSVKKRGGFLFDEMVKGDIDQYLKMKLYVQWPNPVSYYDTIAYEWKLNPDSLR